MRLWNNPQIFLNLHNFGYIMITYNSAWASALIEIPSIWSAFPLEKLKIMPRDCKITSLIPACSFSNYFPCTLQIASCPFIPDQLETKKKKKEEEVKPVLHNKSSNKIYIKFNATNTLTKASWIFKGMSKPNSSSFWSYNRTNKFCSQLVYRMFLMAFILHKANPSFEQNTTSQKHFTEGTFLTICQFLATASFEVGKLNHAWKEWTHCQWLFQPTSCQNSEKFGLPSLSTFGDRLVKQFSQTTDIFPKSFKIRYLQRWLSVHMSSNT